MTWVIWRQYRVTAAIAGAILAAFAVLFLITGLQDATRWHAALASCAKNGTCGNLSQIVSLTTGPVDGPVYTLTILTLAVPLLFGMFWGSPAVARERETGTVQFAWTQSVTRRRWLSVKTGWLLLAGAVFGGAVAGLVTWWYAPLNALHQNQFQPGYFDLQGIVPIGYAVFAVALGIAAGTLIGRSLPALAVTAGVFLAVRLAVTYWVRVHFMPAVTTIYSVTQSFPPKGASWQLATGVVLPGGQFTTTLIAAPGTLQQDPGAIAWPASCQPGQQISSTLTCLAHLGYRSFTTYQPGYRFWPFQFIETGIFVALAAVLIAVTFFAARRGDA
jgi:ABC-type transport system involved in multi-copper enzyme maturation permease subunit